MVLKDDADFLDSGWVMLSENEAFEANLALQEEREKSGKSLSFPRAFEASHTKAEADRIAKMCIVQIWEVVILSLSVLEMKLQLVFPPGLFK